ncbi:LAQU0S20e00980g1_1 [Lachancea quebecensis]|uniref:Pyrroline-5-carboxylate reductase n=1 Tax=Lachancea quebecensis TaxID=1654605 RepID=A0A0P1KXU9_9SACH|nr:LAQU0S20e00980g1_1 [Lachancea quebecensis]
MSESTRYTLTILGCGVMGQALLSAIYNAPEASAETKKFYPSKIITCNHDKDSTSQVVKLLGSFGESPNGIKVECTYNDNERAVDEASVVLLSTKPFLAQEVLSAVPVKQKLLISLVAGWTIGQLGEYSQYVTRIMTNTPAKFGYGMAVLSHSASVSEDNKALVRELVGRVGSCIELPEKNMDAATALVGSGPAFALLILESFMESGLKLGIPLKESKLCAMKVLEGTIKMVEETGEHPSVLKHQVCTPGGTTIAGLCVMEENGVRSGIIKGVEEAAAVASRLGKK